jgi:transposase-like protein
MVSLHATTGDVIMAMNRVQFQPGLSHGDFLRSSLPAFLKQYGTQAACARALHRARWPKGFVCPRCAATACSRFQRAGGWLWQCHTCRHQTNLVSGTLFEHSRLPLTTWFLALYVLTHTKTNVSGLELSRHLGVHSRTAWRLKHDARGGRNATEADGARWVNIVLSNLKRALDGTYHTFKFFKYAHCYLAEAAWRFAHRLVGTIAASGSTPWCRVCSSPSLAVRPWPERKLRDVPVFAG